MEVEAAIADPKKIVIPVLLAPAELPLLTELPPDMRPLLYFQKFTVRPDPEFHGTADRLVKAIMEEFTGSELSSD